MTAVERDEYRHLCNRYVDKVDAYASKINYNLPVHMTVDEVRQFMLAAEVMLVMFQDDMLEKYPLKPLRDSDNTPPPFIRPKPKT